jgi:hypothetical protein
MNKEIDFEGTDRIHLVKDTCTVRRVGVFYGFDTKQVGFSNGIGLHHLGGLQAFHEDFFSVEFAVTVNDPTKRCFL